MHAFGGFRVQGRGEDGQRLLHDAKALEAAGAFSIVLEGIPAPLAAKITASLRVPTIGIGAGPDCDAQVLVWQDMAGLSARSPKFAKRYADVAGVLRTAAAEFAADVASGDLPVGGVLLPLTRQWHKHSARVRGAALRRRHAPVLVPAYSPVSSVPADTRSRRAARAASLSLA